MFRSAIILLSAILLGACTTMQAQQLSGPVNLGEPYGDGLLIGIVADSQLQTEAPYSTVPLYNSAIADRLVPVAIRPPALNWAARAMLNAHLAELRRRGVQAIFYLGDGANNGCTDEFAAGYSSPEGPSNGDGNNLGLLRVLDDFRTAAEIPVYFVLGNHDSFGAGSTSHLEWRKRFCGDHPDRPNTPLLKSDVIETVERFNKESAALRPAWRYTSNYSAETKSDCGANASDQHQSWGCFLAARVDYNGGHAPIQFLLLDSTDWADIKRLGKGRWEFLGQWGGMSIGPARGGKQSQIDWFGTHAGDEVPMRVALAHFDVESLQKKVPVFGALSRLSARMADLFSIRSKDGRVARQGGAYFISGHTHNPGIAGEARQFSVGCAWLGCEARRDLFLTELNIGSTTDFSSYSAIAELRAYPNSSGEIRVSRIRAHAGQCDDVYGEIERALFPNVVPRTGTNKGWEAIGISLRNPANYRYFDERDLAAIRANLRHFARAKVEGKSVVDGRKASCIGLRAAEIEHADPDAFEDESVNR